MWMRALDRTNQIGTCSPGFNNNANLEPDPGPIEIAWSSTRQVGVISPDGTTLDCPFCSSWTYCGTTCTCQVPS
jgi:hypothetical protein